MKKNLLFILSLFFLVLAANSFLQAQRTTDVRQVIIGNGGKFESVPPYTDYVTVETYNLATQLVTVFNTIGTQSVQDVLIDGNHAYVTAQDSIVLYNIDTFQRIIAVADSGVNKMALTQGKLIITKQYPIGRFFTEVLDATNLSLIALIDGIPGDCEGVAVFQNYAFIACDSGYQGTKGRLAVVNTNNWSLLGVADLGADAIGSYSVFPYAGYIFIVNRTPYGGGNIGSITRFDPGNQTFTTHVMNVKIGVGYGISNNLLYMGINNSIGTYDLDTQQIVDTTLFSYFGAGGSIEIHSAAVDYVNNKLYTDLGNRTSFGIGVVFSFTGDSLTSYATGINADACAIDFRTPTGTGNSHQDQDLRVFPNPVDDYIGVTVGTKSTLQEITIYDLTGRTVLTRPVRDNEKNIRINVSGYPSGIYMISFTTDQGTKVRKFVKR
ncbi:MAG: T9SS type A sorting domain-containing protein [Bacteroidetes bacterium]|nr:T9SS type A sorting domain-containing protein [Bacteroidota bacterium]